MENIFDTLNPAIVSMLRNHGIITPTDPQVKIIPIIAEGRNVLLLSPTGSGKTEAAVLPIFDRIMRERPERISVIYITPLRALNRDLLSRLLEYGKELGINVQVRHSDISDQDKRRIVDHPPDILITTPESLQILLNGKRLREIIKNVRTVVVDELHDAAENERGAQLSVALERLRNIAGNFQRIGLSATVGNPDDLAMFLDPEGKATIVNTEMKKKMDIRASIPEPSGKAEAEKMGCDEDYAGSVLKVWDLINSNGGSLVFVNRRYVAEDLAFRLKLMFGDIPVLVHHGSLSKDTRETAENEFKEGKVKALICTSSLELGIDIGTADAVIQFNSPRQINKMIQRIGRSEHWIEKTSKGYIVATDIIELEESMAIIDSVSDGRLEPVSIIENSLSTLSNQVISEVNALKRVSVDDFYVTIKRSYVFRNLQYEEYLSVLNFLSGIKKIWLENGVMGKRRATLMYYIENISMIPSEKNYRVIDISNKFIGTLDERYVMGEVEPGSYFVMKGTTWRTIRIDNDRIIVEPFFTPAIAPKWTGEEIPVLYDVVERVSLNRLKKELPGYLDERSGEKLKEWYKNDIATMGRIIIESLNDEIIIQVLLGTKGNFALAEILSNMLASITGESVESDYSPYHIYLRTSRKIYADDLKQLLYGIKKDDLFSYIKASAIRSRFFKSVFMYEARKFGIISNEADMERIRVDKIVDSYMNTPVYEDAIRKLVFDYMDVDALSTFLHSLDSIEIVMRDSISESSNVFVSHYSERITPLKPTKAILESVRNRIMNETVTLRCMSCGNVRTTKIRDIKALKCDACGSHLLASLSPYERDHADDEKSRKRMVKNAHLVKERGMDAVIVMAARGIGPETASRILEVSYADDDDLIRAILNAEMEFARNRRFW
ncbi:MAG: DEAD/DEAH box helicase, partial [Thermoplasmata archaeon]